MTSTGSCSAIPDEHVDRLGAARALDQAVDQPVGQLLDPRPQPLDVPAGERGADQPAQPGVVRRLHLQDRVAVDQVEALEPLGRLLVRQIRPSRRSRSTALASAWVKASHSPSPSCHCTGATARAAGERRVRVGDDGGVGRGRAERGPSGTHAQR